MGDEYIFDPTNPVTIKDEEGIVIDIYPAIYKVTEPDSDTVSGTLREFVRAGGEEREVRARQVTYTIKD